MVIESYQVHSSGGIKLACTSWHPSDPPEAVLFIVHGLGEHADRYEEMAKTFASQKIAVFAFDHRGHGKSEGKKGHAKSVDQLIEDTEHALMKCRSLFLEIPIFLFGHSMGGQVVASYLNKIKSKEIEGAIISSAWFRLVKPIAVWQLKLVKHVRALFPGITLSNGIDAAEISSVKTEVALYKNDPLIHDKISLSLFYSLFQNGINLINFAQLSKMPVLVCHGASDQITSPQSSEHFAKKLGDKAEFKLWPNAFHDPHHDVDKDMVIQYYAAWIKTIIS